MSKRKRSERAVIRTRRIKAGLCGTCGKRKLAKGRKECKSCLKYYATLAAKYAKKASKYARKAARAAKHGK